MRRRRRAAARLARARPTGQGLADVTDNRFLTQAEVKALCDAAQAAWKRRKPRDAPAAAFEWNGRGLVATRSRFELRVGTADGRPVASRYY